jgi:hypothetical protein
LKKFFEINKTPPPSLHRVPLAAALDNLPSVPSVSPPKFFKPDCKSRAFPHFGLNSNETTKYSEKDRIYANLIHLIADSVEKPVEICVIGQELD